MIPISFALHLHCSHHKSTNNLECSQLFIHIYYFASNLSTHKPVHSSPNLIFQSQALHVCPIESIELLGFQSVCKVKLNERLIHGGFNINVIFYTSSTFKPRQSTLKEYWHRVIFSSIRRILPLCFINVCRNRF